MPPCRDEGSLGFASKATESRRSGAMYCVHHGPSHVGLQSGAPIATWHFEEELVRAGDTSSATTRAVGLWAEKEADLMKIRLHVAARNVLGLLWVTTILRKEERVDGLSLDPIDGRG